MSARSRSHGEARAVGQLERRGRAARPRSRCSRACSGRRRAGTARPRGRRRRTPAARRARARGRAARAPRCMLARPGCSAHDSPSSERSSRSGAPGRCDGARGRPTNSASAPRRSWWLSEQRLGAGERGLDASALLGADAATRGTSGSTPSLSASHSSVSAVGRVLPRSIWLTYSFENRPSGELALGQPRSDAQRAHALADSLVRPACCGGVPRIALAMRFRGEVECSEDPFTCLLDKFGHGSYSRATSEPTAAGIDTGGRRGRAADTRAEDSGRRLRRRAGTSGASRGGGVESLTAEAPRGDRKARGASRSFRLLLAAGQPGAAARRGSARGRGCSRCSRACCRRSEQADGDEDPGLGPRVAVCGTAPASWQRARPRRRRSSCTSRRCRRR